MANLAKLNFCRAVKSQATRILKALQDGDTLKAENDAGAYTTGMVDADTGSTIIKAADIVAQVGIIAGIQGLRTARNNTDLDAAYAVLKTALTALFAANGNIDSVLTKLARG